MAKNIKEMAREYGFANPVIHYDADGNIYDDYDKPSSDFEDGANAVIKVVEEELNRGFLNNFNDFSVHDRDIAQGVIGQIKIFVEQLKSE